MNKFLVMMLLLCVTSGAFAQLTIGTINGTTKSANGAVYSSPTLYFQTVDGTFPGLMTVQQKLQYDSLYNGLKFDTTYLIAQGAGTRIMRPSNDSIYYNTLVAGTGITFTHNADSSITIAAAAAGGYNVEFLYGNGNTGIPIKGGDSVYTNTNLIGKNLVIYLNETSSSLFLQDSTTWVLLGSNPNTPYFKFNSSLGAITFCNFSNVASIQNNQVVISMFGGSQGFYANVDNGTPSAPVLSVTPSSLSGFSTTIGTQSSAQTFTVSGSYLTANATVTAPTGYVVSLSSGSGYGSSVTVTESGGTISATTIYVAIASSAPAGSPSGNVTVASTGATTQNVAVSGTVNPIVAQFNFSATATSGGTGVTNFYGNPTTSLSFTNSATGWTLVTIPAGWVTYDGFFGGSGNGADSASTDGAFTMTSINSNLYSTGNFSTVGYGLKFTNLPAGTYSIELLGSIPTSIFANGGPSTFHVQFGTGSDNVSIAFNPNGLGNPGYTTTKGNLIAIGPGTTNVATGSYNGTITTGQVISIGLSLSGSGQLGYICGLIIKKIG
jgi:hypothetical protein